MNSGEKDPDVCRMLDWERIDSKLEEADDEDILAAAMAYRRGVRVGYALGREKARGEKLTCLAVGASAAWVFWGLVWVLTKVT